MTLSDETAANLVMVILHKNYQQSEKEAELYESFELLKNRKNVVITVKKRLCFTIS